jgi:hypothetical protein
MHKINSLLSRLGLLTVLVLFATVSARAADVDITGFAGMQRQGKLTIRTAPDAARLLNSTNFGVFGARIGHGGVFAGEHTFAGSSNFIDADTRAFIYNSNLLIQAPLPKVRPYGTVGLGLIHTSGDGLGVFGTKFAINYGGGVKVLPAGPVGVRFDLRGYAVPSTEFKVFGADSQRVDFLEVSVGVIFMLKR